MPPELESLLKSLAQTTQTADELLNVETTAQRIEKPYPLEDLLENQVILDSIRRTAERVKQ